MCEEETSDVTTHDDSRQCLHPRLRVAATSFASCALREAPPQQNVPCRRTRTRSMPNNVHRCLLAPSRSRPSRPTCRCNYPSPRRPTCRCNYPSPRRRVSVGDWIGCRKNRRQRYKHTTTLDSAFTHDCEWQPRRLRRAPCVKRRPNKPYRAVGRGRD